MLLYLPENYKKLYWYAARIINISEKLLTLQNQKKGGYNTVPDYYAIAKVVYLHPLKMQFRKNPNIPNDRQLSRAYINTFVFSVSHFTGEILKKLISHRKIRILIGDMIFL